MEKQIQRMEGLLEQSLDTVTSHPTFLNAVSVMLNVNSYRKIWFRKTMEAVWKDLELPIRGDQDKLIHHIEELTVRIKKLELELQQTRVKQTKVAKFSKADNKASATEVEFQ